MKANPVVAVIGVAALLGSFVCGIFLYHRANPTTSFEYRVCFVQDSRVTFVNGVWQGRKAMVLADPQASMDSCPEKWAYLATAGADGWELVAVVPLRGYP